MIRNSKRFDKILFNTVIRADILNVVSQFQKSGDQGDIRSNMTGSTAAGENDSFHKK